jgi:hypothetical protein
VSKPHKLLFAILATCLLGLLGTAPVGAETELSGLNRDPDPYQLYGPCLASGSAYGSKAGAVFATSRTLDNVLAITVLRCRPFSGPGDWHDVSCPAGSPYDYCVANDNDGLGNAVTLGILKMGTSGPNKVYAGCPSGARLRTKLALFRLAHLDPRSVKGLVTLSCTAATQPTAVAPSVVACPSAPHPYTYCIATPNDGRGNAVKIGVLGARAGDPYALYGECNPGFLGGAISRGFRPKSALVTDVGRSLGNVRTIDIIACNAPAPWFPPHPEIRACAPSLPAEMAARYQYCITGTDAKGNGLFAAVS